MGNELAWSDEPKASKGCGNMKSYQVGDIVDVRGKVGGLGHVPATPGSKPAVLVKFNHWAIYVTEDEIVRHAPAPHVFKASDVVYRKECLYKPNPVKGVIIAVKGSRAWVEWPTGDIVMDLSDLGLVQ